MTAKLTTTQFIERARKVHGDKYDYSKTNYVNSRSKVKIICPKHGPFFQKANGHLNGKGCSKCAKTGVRLTQEDFVKRAKSIHGDVYDYSKTSYVNAHTKIEIICPKHGSFYMKPSDHIGPKQCGCPECAKENRYSNTENFIHKAKAVHGNKYDYTKVEYQRSNEKVCIVCPEHGKFWQTPAGHLQGFGCPSCSESQLEKTARIELEEKHIVYEQQKTFEWLINPTTGKHLSLDFYLPNANIAIECQGEQHFSSIEWFGGDAYLESISERDKTKHDTCHKHGISILYFANQKRSNYLDTIYNDINDILKIIIAKEKRIFKPKQTQPR